MLWNKHKNKHIYVIWHVICITLYLYLQLVKLLWRRYAYSYAYSKVCNLAISLRCEQFSPLLVIWVTFWHRGSIGRIESINRFINITLYTYRFQTIVFVCLGLSNRSWKMALTFIFKTFSTTKTTRKHCLSPFWPIFEGNTIGLPNLTYLRGKQDISTSFEHETLKKKPQQFLAYYKLVNIPFWLVSDLRNQLQIIHINCFQSKLNKN